MNPIDKGGSANSILSISIQKSKMNDTKNEVKSSHIALFL